MILPRLVLPVALGVALPFVFVSAATAAVKHIVTPGQTLSYIAEIYETTVEEIAGENGLLDPNVIFPGQEIEIPGTGGGSDDDVTIIANPVVAGAQTYVVQPGDTLGSIAGHLGIDVASLASANGIDDVNLIYAGQVLTVPIPQPVSAPELPALEFPARPDDPGLEATIEQIARQEGVSYGLVKAIATVESGWDQTRISSAGAIGVMQLMPGTVEWLEADVFGFDLNERASAHDNVRLGVRYLRILADATDGDMADTVAAYYQGLSPTEAGVYYADTADYVSMVLAVKAAYWPF